MYDITSRSKKIAKENNLIIKPSDDGKHKIDVYDKKGFITSIGATGYDDYNTYLNTKTKEYADNRKRLYNIRHKNDNNIKGKLAKLILWT
jgi:hypothetical protein